VRSSSTRSTVTSSSRCGYHIAQRPNGRTSPGHIEFEAATASRTGRLTPHGRPRCKSPITGAMRRTILRLRVDDVRHRVRPSSPAARVRRETDDDGKIVHNRDYWDSRLVPRMAAGPVIPNSTTCRPSTLSSEKIEAPWCRQAHHGGLSHSAPYEPSSEFPSLPRVLPAHRAGRERKDVFKAGHIARCPDDAARTRTPTSRRIHRAVGNVVAEAHPARRLRQLAGPDRDGVYGRRGSSARISAFPMPSPPTPTPPTCNVVTTASDTLGRTGPGEHPVSTCLQGHWRVGGQLESGGGPWDFAPGAA